MAIVSEHRLRRLFADRGYRVREIRRNRHYWIKAERESGGPPFCVSVSTTPGSTFFERTLGTAIRRAERAAASRNL
jgi:hypothetical protein